MKIQQLFNELEKIKETSESDFDISGMINRFKEMQYGFFPLGWGILTENNKTQGAAPTNEIEEGGIMVLGNDFGTVGYVNSYINNPEKKIGEIDSKTIKNLLNEKVDIDPDKTFFTNFYLGVRTHPSATMRQRVEELTTDYKKVCFKFFIAQLNLINPKIVICLGHEVKNALIQMTTLFNQWTPKSISIEKIYIKSKDNHIVYTDENTELGKRIFIIIPHPCYLKNFDDTYRRKLNELLLSN